MARELEVKVASVVEDDAGVTWTHLRFYAFDPAAEKDEDRRALLGERTVTERTGARTPAALRTIWRRHARDISPLRFKGDAE